MSTRSDHPDPAEAGPSWFAVPRALPCRARPRPGPPSPRASLRGKPPLPAAADPSRSAHQTSTDARASAIHRSQARSVSGTGASSIAASPSWRRLSAALPSRSRDAPQVGHVHDRSPSARPAFTAPQHAQRLLARREEPRRPEREAAELLRLLAHHPDEPAERHLRQAARDAVVAQQPSEVERLGDDHLGRAGHRGRRLMQ